MSKPVFYEKFALYTYVSICRKSFFIKVYYNILILLHLCSFFAIFLPLGKKGILNISLISFILVSFYYCGGTLSLWMIKHHSAFLFNKEDRRSFPSPKHLRPELVSSIPFRLHSRFARLLSLLQLGSEPSV